jgi:molybdopterin-guanine dinucleotide biosynthesis protein A
VRHTAVRGAVLCGGASRRMGRDKATLEIDGRPLGARAIDALHHAGVDQVVCVGGDPVLLEPLGAPVVADQWPGRGPLGGVLTALDWASATDEAGSPGADITVVLACDLLGVDAAVVAALLDALARQPDALVAVAEAEGDTGVLAAPGQWLHAAWRSGARAPLAARFTAGERSIRRAAASLTTVRVPLPGVLLTDADEPTDLPGPP